MIISGTSYYFFHSKGALFIMNSNSKLYTLTISAVLCAVGILIPLFSPVKILIEPASFTLASHVAIFIAMYISPPVALFVAAGTTSGFFLAGFPIVIVFRAATHMVFAGIGSYVLKSRPEILNSIYKASIFSFLIALVHSICEILVVIPFYFGGVQQNSFFFSVLLLVGVGTVVHSMVDFQIAYLVWKPVKKAIAVKA